MQKSVWKLAIIALVTLTISFMGPGLAGAKGPGSGGGGGGGGSGGKPGGETAGNNLSYPVIWAEGVQKTLPGTPGMEPATGRGVVVPVGHQRGRIPTSPPRVAPGSRRVATWS